MDTVFVHIGSKPIPSYMKTAIEQAQKITKGRTWIISEKEFYVGSKCIWWDAKKLMEWSDDYKEFMHHNHLNSQGFGDFWTVTLARMFLIETMMLEEDIKEILHIENDVLIYQDPDKLNFPYDVNITKVTNQHDSLAYTVIKNRESLKWMNRQFVELIKFSKTTLMRLTGANMITEMTLLPAIVEKSKGKLGYLSTVPNRDEEILFDGASIGQFLFGIPNKPTPGFRDPRHYFHQYLDNNDVEFIWENNKLFLEENKGKKYQIANLHIHSKQLDKVVEKYKYS